MRWLVCAVILAVLVLGIIIVPGAAGSDRPAIIVAIAAVVVAALGVLVQSESARGQHKLAEQQLTMTKRQGELNAIMRELGFAPVLTGRFTSDGITVRNVGKGTAYDLRAVTFPPSGGTPMRCAITHGTPHLAPGECAGFQREGGSGGADVSPDVWIVHCGYVMGKPHFHAWCNWTRTEDGDEYRKDEPFIFESFDRTPPTIRQACLRCHELGLTHSKPLSDS